ncbi:DUF262 domain-containing protein [Nocardia sp. NPDC057440]|uniref:GmrSD restriction endonuclease domain-containing protein n=1 Tax=Nocardia sp. NPDC057440 TaxID=3346134 RepID=UPI00366A5EBA
MVRRSGGVQDPEPTVPRLETLAERVLEGDVILPRFQRKFVWSAQQVLNLLDSVARGYPIGSVLLWQTSDRELASERSIAGLDIDPPRPGYPVNYVLDGQQRLASICGALFWQPDSDPENRWNIVYDLRTSEFSQAQTFDDSLSHLLPVRLLSTPSDYFARVAAIPDQDLSARAKLLYERFTNYQIAVVTLRGMSESEVAKVFERINSTHTPLTIVDLMRAATWSRSFDLQDEIDTLLEVLDRKNYGHVDDKTLLRTIAASAGFGFARDDMQGLRKLPQDRLEAAVADAAKAARRAVDFLATEIGTPKAAALPYLNQFAVLVEIFRRVPTPTSSQRSAVERWFWLTASGEYFKGWNARQMADDLVAVGAFADGATEIDVNAPIPREKLWTSSQFRANNAPAKLLGLLLADAGPKDLRSGQCIDVGRALAWQNDKEFHHFFPKAFLKSAGVSAARANVCANLIMLTSITNIHISDQRPSMYLKDLCDMEGESVIRERLARSYVDDAAYEAALRDDYGAFLEARAMTLHRRLMELIGPVGSSPYSRALVVDEPGVDTDGEVLIDRDSVD